MRLPGRQRRRTVVAMTSLRRTSEPVERKLPLYGEDLARTDLAPRA